jgi:hypothetical protein
VQEKFGLVADEIHNHKHHLLFFVGDLVEIEGRKVQFIVALKHVFKRGQSVHEVPVAVVTVFVNFHSRCAAAHFLFKLNFFTNLPG